MTDDRKQKRVTYAELLVRLSNFTPEQLAQPIVWSGEERGGYIREIYEHDEDWLGDSYEEATRRSEAVAHWDPSEVEGAEVIIPRGTVHLMVD